MIEIPHHPVLGAVRVAEQDQAAFRAFESYLPRAMAAASAMGVRELPVRTTLFTGVQVNPAFDPSPSNPTLYIGAAPPRAGGPHSFSIVSMHELAHVVLLQYFAQRSEVSYEVFIAAHRNQRREFTPLNEFFADAFAAVIVDDPAANARELEEYTRWLDALNPLDRLLLRMPPLGSFEEPRRQLPLRDFSGSESPVCLVRPPEVHNWYDGSRRVLWRDVWEGRMARSQAQAPRLLAGLAEILYLEFLRVNLDEARNPGGGNPDSGVRRGQDAPPLSQPMRRMQMGEDFLDQDLSEAIRHRFLAPRP